MATTLTNRMLILHWKNGPWVPLVQKARTALIRNPGKPAQNTVTEAQNSQFGA